MMQFPNFLQSSWRRIWSAWGYVFISEYANHALTLKSRPISLAGGALSCSLEKEIALAYITC